MVETIVPMVHGEKTRRWRAAAALHVAGSGAAGALLGLVAGSVGAGLGRLGLPDGLAGATLLATASAGAARETWSPGSWLPGRRRQVPREWSEALSPAASSFLYGSGLGLGFATHVHSAAYWVVVVASATSGDPAQGAALGAVFGLARAGAVVGLTTRLTGWDGVSHRQSQLNRAEGGMRRATSVVLALLAGATLTFIAR